MGKLAIIILTATTAAATTVIIIIADIPTATAAAIFIQTTARNAALAPGLPPNDGGYGRRRIWNGRQLYSPSSSSVQFIVHVSFSSSSPILTILLLEARVASLR